MKDQFKQIQLGEVNCIEITSSPNFHLRMERLVSILSEQGKLDSFLGGILAPRLLVAKSKFFFFDCSPFFQALAKRHPLIEVKFGLILARQNETRASIRARIVRQIQMESLVSPDAVEVFAFEKANADTKLFGRKDYAKALGCKANSLNYYDKKYRKARVQNESSITVVPIDYQAVLNHVSELPARKAEGAEGND